MCPNQDYVSLRVRKWMGSKTGQDATSESAIFEFSHDIGVISDVLIDLLIGDEFKTSKWWNSLRIRFLPGFISHAW